MRVIGGQLRSRRLHPPLDADTTRPITDRVKEALFNRLMAAGRLGGGAVLDIFSGTGSLGIEALSRGCDTATFIERDRVAAGLLKRNIRELGLGDRCTLRQVDAFTADLAALVGGGPVSLVFCDPPYRIAESSGGMNKLVTLLGRAARLLEPESAVILRLPRELTPPSPPGLVTIESFIFGSMRLVWYEPAAPGDETKRCQDPSLCPTESLPSVNAIDSRNDPQMPRMNPALFFSAGSSLRVRHLTPD